MQTTQTEQTGVSNVVTGRIEITGTVREVSEKLYRVYGRQYRRRCVCWRILVQDDRSFVVWGTAAKALRWFDTGDLIINPGDRVRFTATVEASEDDKTFGFFKRPVNATVLAVTETTLNAIGDVQEAYLRYPRGDGLAENYPWVKDVEVIPDP